MMKRCRNLCRTGPFLLAVLVLLLSGCSTAKRASGTENGLRIEADQKEYVLCSPFALKPISVGDLYAQAENASYYQIPYQDPGEFICDLDEASGSSFVYRSTDVPEVTLKSFDAVSAWIYLDGKEPTLVGQLYADDEFLPEEKRGLNASQDTALVRSITSALTEGTPVTVPDSDYSDADTFYFRMLGPTYPGLYYLVCFFADLEGNYYLEDMGTFTIVSCPSDVRMRMVGE